MEEVPAFIQEYRKRYSGQSAKQLTQTYYAYLEKIYDAKNNANYSEMAQYCMLSWALIESLIIEVKQEYSTFDLTSIPAIEEALNYYSVMGYRGQMNNMAELVNFFPELSNLYTEQLTKAFEKLKVGQKLRKYIGANPGCIQSDLKDKVGLSDGRLLSQVMYWMEKFGLVHREKVGRSYKVKLSYK